MNKWNVRTNVYETYKIPDNWYCPLYCNDLTTTINCASCGKQMEYGAGYTSALIHNKYGIGYTVCEACKYLENKQLKN